METKIPWPKEWKWRGARETTVVHGRPLIHMVPSTCNTRPPLFTATTNVITHSSDNREKRLKMTQMFIKIRDWQDWWFSKCGSMISSSTWEFVPNASSQALPWTYSGGPAVCFHKASRWCWCTHKSENQWVRKLMLNPTTENYWVF